MSPTAHRSWGLADPRYADSRLFAPRKVHRRRTPNVASSHGPLERPNRPHTAREVLVVKVLAAAIREIDV